MNHCGWKIQDGNVVCSGDSGLLMWSKQSIVDSPTSTILEWQRSLPWGTVQELLSLSPCLELKIQTPWGLSFNSLTRPRKQMFLEFSIFFHVISLFRLAGVSRLSPGGPLPAEFGCNLPQHFCVKFLACLVRPWLAGSGVINWG